MPLGETKRSQSAAIFDTFRKESYSTNHSNKPPSKCLREGDDNPKILICKASTVTMITDNMNEDQKFLITPIFAERNKEQQAIKLNSLKDQSHREILLQYIV